MKKDCLEEISAVLLAWREKTEKTIAELSVKRGSLCQDYDLRKEKDQLEEEWFKITGLLDNNFARLKRINLRLEDIRSGRFSGKCPKCGQEIVKGDLQENPMMDLCCACQKEINNH